MKGFTLLEMLLAISLGGLLLVVCVGMFASVERTDRVLAERHWQAEEMATIHRVMDRAMSNMLMATEAQAATELQNRAGIVGGERLHISRPRLLLEEDVAAHGIGLTVQRLEVVLSRAPVPPGFGRDMVVTEVEHAMGGPVRGVFELRPDEQGLAMWWRPLPPDEMDIDGYRYRLDPREDEFAVRLASGLTEAKWLAFKNRERQPQIEAKVSHDLPAHMELHVQMSSGYASQWMFEIQWINGAETPEEIEAEQEEEQLAIPGGRRAQDGRGGGGSAGDGSTTPAARPATRTGGRNVARPGETVDRAVR